MSINRGPVRNFYFKWALCLLHTKMTVKSSLITSCRLQITWEKVLLKNVKLVCFVFVPVFLHWPAFSLWNTVKQNQRKQEKDLAKGRTHPSLLWLMYCPLVETCWLRSGFFGGAGDDRSRPRWPLLLLLMCSSFTWAFVTSFHSCCSSAGIMPETNKLDN